MVAGQNPGAQFTTVTLGCEENGRGRGSIRELRRTNYLASCGAEV